MTRLSLLLVLCLLLSGRSAPAGEAPELTVEEARASEGWVSFLCN